MIEPRVAPAIRVLLVDDHRTVLWGLEKLVESAGPAMVVAGTAISSAQAIEIAKRTHPDVILLDSELGLQSGIDAIPDLIFRSKAKVLLLTEERNQALHDRAVLAGARGIVYKQDPPEKILVAIEKVHSGEVWLDRMTTGRLLDELQNGAGRRRQTPDWAATARLTTRERELVGELVQDPSASYNRVAAKLHITAHTVRNHLTSIYSKLGVQNRLELFVYASKNGVPTAP